MRFRGIFFGVVVLAGAAFAAGAPTARAMPANDLRLAPAKMFVPDPDLTGVRRKAERVNGPAIDPELLTVAPFDDAADPPLVQPVAPAGLQPFSNCPGRLAVMAEPGSTDWFAQRTVWYEITKDATGAPFPKNTLVTIDTGGSTFAAALEVFSGDAPPAAFNPGDPVLPANVVACDRNPITVVPAVVSFITQKNTRYWLMAGVAPVPASPSSGNLRLSMRILDVEAPPVTVRLDEIPDASSVFEYTVGTSDTAAVGSQLNVTQTKGNTGRELTRLLLGSKCDAARLKSRTRAGTYCMRGSSIFVHWAPVGTTAQFGRVSISYQDRAGNVGSNSLQTQLRDRTPPIITRASARWTSRGRLFVTATCTGGPGKIAVQYGTAKKSAGRPQTFNSTRNTTMRLRQAFPRVTRRTTFLHVVCTDRSMNADDTWLFLPR